MKKMIKIMIACTLLAALILTGCGKKKEEQAAKPDNQNPMQEIVDEIVENAPDQVGEYVTPAEDCFVWDSTDGGVMITGYTGEEKAVAVPETLGGEKVVAIGAGAFNEAAVVGVKLPDTVTKLENKAFYFCTSLVEIYLGKGLESIGAQAFEGCMALATVEEGDAMTDIGEMAFANCQSLKQITLPEGLKTIQKGAFGLTGLESVVIPGSLTEIGEQAFTCCESLKTVEIQTGVTIIGKKAFETCSALETIDIPDSVTVLGIRVFNQCKDVCVVAPAGSAAESYANENNIAFKAA